MCQLKTYTVAKKYKLLYCLLIISFYSTAQTQITGKVLSEKNEPIPFANIWLDSLYDGATTDKEGTFNFKSEYRGKAYLMVSCLGYQTEKKAIILNGNELVIDMKMTSKTKHSMQLLSQQAVLKPRTKRKQ